VILPDEPITGVTVWDDANFNRQLDTGEAFGLTDSTGNFSMLLPTHSLNFTALVFQRTWQLARARTHMPFPTHGSVGVGRGL
jgi:hypothetical protein